MFYVYKWFIKETNEVFYIGKGINNRYKDLRRRNNYFNNIYKKYNCDVRIVKYFDKEEDAFEYEKTLINYYKQKNQAKANFHIGGSGGNTLKHMPEDLKEKYIQKMRKINKKRCNNYDFKNNTSTRMKQLYSNPEEREKQSKLLKEVWKNEELKNKHSEIIKKSYTPELRKIRSEKAKKKLKMILNEEIIIFNSRKEFLEYIKINYNLTLSNYTIAYLLKGNPYKGHRKEHRILNNMKISYIEEDVETIENLPVTESE